MNFAISGTQMLVPFRFMCRHLLLLLMSAGAAVWLYLVTLPFETGISPDSMLFLSMAHHIAAGKGASVHLKMFAGTSDALASSPPLLSFLMGAAYFLFNLPPIDAGWYLNLFLFGANIFLAGFMVNRFTGLTWPGLLTAVFLILGSLWRTYHAWLLSEPLFLFLIQLSILALWKYFESERRRWLLTAALLTGGICMTRYAGMAYIAAGFLCVVVLDRKGWRERILRAVFFGFYASLPLALWLARNYYHLRRPGATVGQIIFGHVMWKHENPNTFLENWLYAADSIAQWIPDLLGFKPSGITLAAGFILIPAVVLIAARVKPPASGRQLTNTLPLILSLYAATCYFFIIYSLTVNSSKCFIPNRYQIPTYTNILCLVMMGAGAFSHGYFVPPHLKKTRSAMLAFFLAWTFVWSGLKAQETADWTLKVQEKGIDDTKGARHHAAESENWFPDPATSPYYKMLRDYRAMSRGMVPTERYE